MREVLDPEPKLLWGLAPKAALHGREEKILATRSF